MPRYIKDEIAAQLDQDPVLGASVTQDLVRALEEFNLEFRHKLYPLDFPRDNTVDDLAMAQYRNNTPGEQAEFLARYDLATMRQRQAFATDSSAATEYPSMISSKHRIEAYWQRNWYTDEFIQAIGTMPII